jgi:hypothetical protein
MRAITSIFWVGLILLTADAATPEATWPCGAESDLVNQGGKIVWLSPEQLDKRALQRTPVKIPPTLRINGTITVDIIIGVDGHVKCVRALKGHPILKKAAMEAAQEWVFSPYESDHRQRAVCGHLLFEVHQ